MSPHSPVVPSPGDVLAGKYRVERVVGIGGMGVVVAAQHIALEERVALKLLRREVMRPDTIARFLREAKAAVKIKSEHVARVTDVGTLPDGVPYMVMELLEGEDLGQMVQDRGALSPAKAADYVLQACEAIAEAHALGIVHRDLKPQNLFLARRPGGHKVVKVLDFGISKQVGEGSAPSAVDTGTSPDALRAPADAATTHSQAWLGSPLYMSPEQMRSAKDVDLRTDLWSLGLILFELCTEHAPFDAPTVVELCARVLHDQPTPLETWLPDPPPVLVSTIARCLQKDRDARFADVAELALALLPLSPSARPRVDRIVAIIQGVAGTDPGPTAEDAQPMPLLRPAPRPAPSPVPAPVPVPVPVSVPDPAVITGTGTGQSEDQKPRRRAGIWLLLLLMLICTGVGAGAYLRTGRSSGSLPAPPPPRDPVVDTATPVVTAAPPAPATATAEPPVVSTVTTDAGSPPRDAGYDSGPRPGSRGPRIAPPAIDHPSGKGSAPVPKAALKPEILSETCYQTMADGTRKVIPCP